MNDRCGLSILRANIGYVESGNESCCAGRNAGSAAAITTPKPTTYPGQRECPLSCTGPPYCMSPREAGSERRRAGFLLRFGLMIRKIEGGYRIYSRKKDPKTGRRRNLGTFRTREAAEKHERAIQFFKHH